MICLLSIPLALGAIVVAFVQSAGAQRVTPVPVAASLPVYGLPSPQPSYIPFYTSAPSPIPSAYAAIGGAFGAANIYNTGQTPGTAMLNTRKCAFLCYGAPGVASSSVIAMGNDASSGTSFTTVGAPDDCGSSGSLPPCPAGIVDRVFAIEGWRSAAGSADVLIAINQFGQLGVSNGVYAAGAVVAGAAVVPSPGPSAGTPMPTFPSPSPGSLVSRTGDGSGDVLLGSISNYVKCDYGETAPSMLTCNKPIAVVIGSNGAGINATGTVWATGGVQPHSRASGGSGGYAPEAFPDGTAEPHPQIITGNCAVEAPSYACTFPNRFSFGGSYECTISAQGTSAVNSSYQRMSSNSGITIYTNTSATFSYTCMG